MDFERLVISGRRDSRRHSPGNDAQGIPLPIEIPYEADAFERPETFAQGDHISRPEAEPENPNRMVMEPCQRSDWTTAPALLEAGKQRTV